MIHCLTFLLRSIYPTLVPPNSCSCGGNRPREAGRCTEPRGRRRLLGPAPHAGTLAPAVRPPADARGFPLAPTLPFWDCTKHLSQSDRRLGARPALAQKAPIPGESAQLIDNTVYKKKNYRRWIVELTTCLPTSKGPKLSGRRGHGGGARGGFLGRGARGQPRGSRTRGAWLVPRGFWG